MTFSAVHHHPDGANEVFGFFSYAREDFEPYRLQEFIKEVEASVNEELKHPRFKDKLNEHRFIIRSDAHLSGSSSDFWLEIRGLIEKAQIYFIVLSPRFSISRYFTAEYRAILNSPGEKLIHVYCIEREHIHKDFWETYPGQEIGKGQIHNLPRPEDRNPKKYPGTQSENNGICFKYTHTLHKLSKEIADFIQRQSATTTNKKKTSPQARNPPHLLTRREINFSILGTAGAAAALLLFNLKKQNSSTPSTLLPTRNGSLLPKVRWKMGDEFSRNKRNGTSLFGAKYISDLVEEMSNGQFLIELDDSFDKDSNLLELVHQGAIQCSYGPSYYYAEKYPSLIFGTTVPFGLNAQQQLSWLNHSYENENSFEIEERNSKLKVMQSHYQDLGLSVIPFTAGGTGGQMGGWFREEIPSDVASFAEYAKQKLGSSRKFRFRVIGLAGEIIKKNEPTVEIYEQKGKDIRDALEKGELDAAEWIGPLEDMAINLDTVRGIRYYYYPGWWDPGTTYQLQVNLEAWKDLPLQFKLIVKAACLQAYHEILTYYDNSNSELLDSIRKNGIQLRRFPDKLVANMRMKTTAFLEEKFGRNSDAKAAEKRLYSEWKSYNDRIKGWYDYIDSV